MKRNQKHKLKTQNWQNLQVLYLLKVDTLSSFTCVESLERM